MHTRYSSTGSCVVLVLAVGTTRAARATAVAAGYTARCYCILLAAAACYTARRYRILLVVRMRVRRAAACYTYSRATCCRLLLTVVIPNDI